MKERINIYFFITASLSILIPTPGRLAFAIVLLFLMNIQIALGTLVFHASKRLGLKNLKNVLIVLFLVFSTSLYKIVLSSLCPIIALTLGFCLYLPSLSTVAIAFFFEKRDVKFSVRIKDLMNKSLQLSAGVLLYFILREIVGYGTISFPKIGGIIILHLPFTFGGGVFFATIPGNFALIAVILATFVFVRHKFTIVENAKKAQVIEQNEEEL